MVSNRKLQGTPLVVCATFLATLSSEEVPLDNVNLLDNLLDIIRCRETHVPNLIPMG